MQTRKDGELFSSRTGRFDELTEELGDQLDKGVVDSGTIANIPSEGDKVTVNGLKWEVKASYGGNRITLELLNESA